MALPRGLAAAWFPGWPRRLPLAVGADSISARGCLRRRRVRRDEGIPPYGRPGGCGCPVWRVVSARFVGEGHAPPVDVPAAANRADISGLRAGPYGPVGLRNAPAGAVESAPTGVCHTVKTVVYRLAAHLSPRTNLIFQATHPYCLPQKTRKIPHSSFLIPNFLPPSCSSQPRKKTLSLRPRVWYTIGVWAAARAALKTKWRLPP